jgi:hypothetical protein
VLRPPLRVTAARQRDPGRAWRIPSADGPPRAPQRATHPPNPLLRPAPPPPRQTLLSVGQDGAIYVAPVDSARQQGQQQQQQQQHAPFRRGAGYSGYSQGRWMDSNTFVTVGGWGWAGRGRGWGTPGSRVSCAARSRVPQRAAGCLGPGLRLAGGAVWQAPCPRHPRRPPLPRPSWPPAAPVLRAQAGLIGGLQLWDVRAGGAGGPVASSPREWGHTGCADVDAAAGAARQLLCLDVHPARPNVAASGGSGGTVAVWDLRMAAAPAAAGGLAGGGDVWEVRFDPLEEFGRGGALGGGAPPLLFCTSSGELARAGGGGGGKGGAGLTAEVLLQEACSVNSFDAHPAGGDVMAVTDFEGLLFAARA